MPGGVARVRGPPVRPVHVGVHGKTKGCVAHHWRLHDLRRDDLQVRLRYEAGRHILLHGRLRLDHRALLRGLRPYAESSDTADLRRGAELPEQRSALARGGQVLRHPALHRADSDPRPHADRRGPRQGHQPRVAPGTGVGGRADQPGGVAVVPRRRGRGAVPDRGHVVADRDRRHHDHPAAHQGLRREARLRVPALLRHRACAHHAGGQGAGGGHGGFAGNQVALALDHPRSAR
mmetsp:Transcript_93889/g.265848  ORF Transcript_93889/g.265848 Transcript_93889/m.265848 type:complete len:234 (+) Transcript_93889:1087-1788(+)